MESFKEIKSPQLDLQTIVRIQQNVAAWTKQFDAPPILPVLEIVSSSSITSYTVKPDDGYLVVNARGGPIKIVLPTPNRATQAVKILNAIGPNTVTIVQADGGAMGAGAPEIALASGESADMANTGKGWFRFGVA